MKLSEFLDSPTASLIKPDELIQSRQEYSDSESVQSPTDQRDDAESLTILP